MEENPPKVVLDTNVIISALLFGGTPKLLIKQVEEKNLINVTSSFILAETHETFIQKMHLDRKETERLDKKIRKISTIVKPKKKISVVRDSADDKIIEAALEGKCEYIITGDRDLLELGEYKDIKIVSPAEFLEEFSE